MKVIFRRGDDHIEAAVSELFVEVNCPLFPDAEAKVRVKLVQFPNGAGQKVRADCGQGPEPVAARKITRDLPGDRFQVFHLCQNNPGTAYDFRPSRCEDGSGTRAFNRGYAQLGFCIRNLFGEAWLAHPQLQGYVTETSCVRNSHDVLELAKGWSRGSEKPIKK